MPRVGKIIRKTRPATTRRWRIEEPKLQLWRTQYRSPARIDPSIVYTLPPAAGGTIFLREAAGGLQITGLARVQTGRYYSITGNFSMSGLSNQRAQYLGGSYYSQGPLFSLDGHVAIPESGGLWSAELLIPGAETGLALYTPEGHESRIGQFHSIAFWCDDVFATSAILKEKGVLFAQEPKKEPWGSTALIMDADGNQFALSSKG